MPDICPLILEGVVEGCQDEYTYTLDLKVMYFVFRFLVLVFPIGKVKEGAVM